MKPRNEEHYGHPLQYALWRDMYVGHTENIADDDIRRTLLSRLPANFRTIVSVDGPIYRFNRCPACEQWSPCDRRARGTDRKETAMIDSLDVLVGTREPAPYMLLTDEQRDILHAFLAAHGIDYSLVPLDAEGEYDPVTQTWVVEMFVRATHGGLAIDRTTGAAKRVRQVVPAQPPYNLATRDALDALGWWPQ